MPVFQHNAYLPLPHRSGRPLGDAKANRAPGRILLAMYMEEGHGGCCGPHHETSNAHELGYVTLIRNIGSVQRSVLLPVHGVGARSTLSHKGICILWQQICLRKSRGGKTEWAYSGAKDCSRLASIGWQVDKKLYWPD